MEIYSQQIFFPANFLRDEGTSSAGVFIGGFVLGGIIVGTLGCVFAPQISKVLAGTDRKDLMRRLPKFIYDEEKALEVANFTPVKSFMTVKLGQGAKVQFPQAVLNTGFVGATIQFGTISEVMQY
ncbi:hypothetical protein M5K25_001682 [Dendrobium thyrsiflorum]|uniref:Uncharacterized protein n=1 Tax=Dendrobium thyrsiflorum TaxID=117978 RepID=A0ABD0VZ33_DENTH